MISFFQRFFAPWSPPFPWSRRPVPQPDFVPEPDMDDE